MIKVIVCGACGKMGSRIVSLVGQDKEMDLVGLIEEPTHQEIDELIESVLIENDLEESLKNRQGMIDFTPVIIEFTNPKATMEHLEVVARHKKAIVIGTTGLNDGQIVRVRELSKNIPCVLAPNMSAGVNLLFRLAKETAKALPDYDVEIIEVHHNQKKDAPSGTADKLTEVVALGYASADPEAAKNRIISHGRSRTSGPRKPEEIGVHAVRAGDIVGEHTVLFAGPGERIELIHRAHSRDVFAHGAIKAAKWIVGKPAGFYDMQDVLGLK